ncbi:MAG: TIGR00529 family membrane protein [Promethearchaeota archaeon]
MALALPPPWLAFALSLAAIVVVSKWDLGLALLAGAFLLALGTGVDPWTTLGRVLSNPKYVFLAVAVTLIPLIGGVMERTGMMKELVESAAVPTRAALMVSPALFGLLPMPGGALLSAPVVQGVAPDLPVDKKVAANVWFRHVFMLVYPAQSALIVGVYLAGYPDSFFYVAIASLLVPFTAMTGVGYAFLVRGAEDSGERRQRDVRTVARNALPVLVAPFLDLLGRQVFHVPVPEAVLCVGLVVGLAAALLLSGTRPGSLAPVAKQVKVWRYPLMIVAMFAYLEVFLESGLPELLGALDVPLVIFACVAFGLGLATGREQLPVSVLFPVYLAQRGLAAMPLLHFAVLYFSVFLGYVVTPVHPCVAYTLEYFEADARRSLLTLLKPTLACFTGTLLVASLA